MLLWTDIETTGLEPKLHKILEIGFVITDDNLVERARRAWVLRFDGRVDDFIGKMHGPEGSGLLAECAAAEFRVPSDVNAEIGGWLADYITDPKNKPPLCGSSVHFDRAFLAASPFFPILQYATYRNIDISTIKELAQRWTPPIYENRPKPGAKHRALPDLDDSIAEAKHYRKYLFTDC